MVGRTSELHPDAAEFVETLELPPRPAQTVAAAREALDAVLIEERPRPIDAAVTDYRIPADGGEVRLRAYVPDTANAQPVVLYFHGGGWVRGNIETHDDLCRRLQQATGWSIVSVDYRLAPENPFPTPHEDAYAVLEWVASYPDLINADTDSIIVAGDSAGGNLAASVALRARDMDGPSILGQVLLYPITNYAFDTDSYEENADGPLLTRIGMEWYWDQYLPTPLYGMHPYASPTKASTHDGLPPAIVVTAGFDPLRDEGAAYANTLADAGVYVDHIHYDDMIHAFLSFPALEPAAEAMDEIATRMAQLR